MTEMTGGVINYTDKGRAKAFEAVGGVIKYNYMQKPATCSHEPFDKSDTESADVRPKDHRNFPIKLTSFFKKTKDRLPEDEDAENAKPDDDDSNTKPEEGAGELPKKTAGGDETKEGGIVYAELDLVSPIANLKPVVKNDDEKTEYAEIVYAPNETEQKSTPT